MCIAAKENLTEKQATDIVNLIFSGFADTLKKGDRIEIRSFGSFAVREYESYKGRNPRTGKNVDVRPKKLPFFKVGKELKGLVDGKEKQGSPEEYLRLIKPARSLCAGNYQELK